jgi:hypothetical protein
MAPPRTRTIAIVALVAVLMALVGVGAVRAGGDTNLPPIGADRLMASAFQALSEPVTVSGDVESRIELGLPEVPAALGGEGGPIAMVSGTQRFRVWHSPAGLRVAHVTQVSERDLVVNAREAWWWDGAEMTATRIGFDDVRAAIEADPSFGPMMGSPRHGHRAQAQAAAAVDPVFLARKVIDALAPYASVSVEATNEVAGRPVYDLVLTPLTDVTLIARIDISIDAETSVPLRVQVVSRATGDPAISAGFTTVSFDAIDPSVFEFSPPPGVEVVDGLDAFDTRIGPLDGRSGSDLRDGAGHDAGGPDVRTIGEGFATRIAVPLSGDVPEVVSGLLPYAGPLVSAMAVEADGSRWLLVGAVPLDVLQGDAASL